MSYIKEYIDFSNKICDISGEIIKSEYGRNNVITPKKDFSLVTEIDQKVEKTITSEIKNKYPDHSILGEEFGQTINDSIYKWVIDPIDGTNSFIINRPIFGTLISLLRDNKPILGVIDQPILNQRWIGAEGYHTTLNGKKVFTSRCNDIEESILCTTSPSYFDKDELRLFNIISQKSLSTVYGGDCYNYAQLSNGKVDLVIESQMKPYDFCGLVKVVDQAGGFITDWNGKEINCFSDGKIIAAATKELHKNVLCILKNNR